MAVNLSPIGNIQQFFNASGKPLAGGKINTYAAGTITPQSTFADNGGVNTNPNPIILDANGRSPVAIWLTAQVTYKFVITDANNNTITTLDNISGVNDVQSTPVTPSGSVMVFPQTTVPTGWTRISTFDDAALRIVGSAVPGSGGVNGFLSQLVNQITSTGTALSLSQIPVHTHSYGVKVDAGHGSGSEFVFEQQITPPVSVTISTTNQGSGAAHSHTVTLNTKYLDVLIASKN